MIVLSATVPTTPPLTSPAGTVRSGDMFDLSLARAAGKAPAGHDGAKPQAPVRQVIADHGRILPDRDAARGKPADGKDAEVAARDDIDAGHDAGETPFPAAIDPTITMTIAPLAAPPPLPMDAARADAPAVTMPAPQPLPLPLPGEPSLAPAPQADTASVSLANAATEGWQAVAPQPFAGEPATGAVTAVADKIRIPPLTVRDPAMPIDKTPVPPPLPSTVSDTIAPASPVGTTAPAGQVFAAAIIAWSHDETGPGRDDRTPLPLAPIAATLPTIPVAAAADAQTATLDMRRDHWPQGMIDHIERLRDDADAVDTRIRVVPDALGTIDVSVRRQGDAVHVHLAAEQAATRTLLSEAAPQLAELAEQRGLKLGQTMVDAGTTGHEQPRREAPAPSFPAPRAPTPADATASVETDQRIA